MDFGSAFLESLDQDLDPYLKSKSRSGSMSYPIVQLQIQSKYKEILFFFYFLKGKTKIFLWEKFQIFQALDPDPHPDPDPYPNAHSFSKPWIRIRKKWMRIRHSGSGILLVYIWGVIPVSVPKTTWFWNLIQSTGKISVSDRIPNRFGSLGYEFPFNLCGSKKRRNTRFYLAEWKQYSSTIFSRHAFNCEHRSHLSM